MTTLADAVAAPITIELRGVQYKCRPLTLAATGEIERWLQAAHIEVTERNLKALDLPAPTIERLRLAAFERASRIHVRSPEGAAMLSTAEGGCRLVHAMLQHDQPALTIGDVRDMMSDPATKLPDRETIDRCMDVFSILHPVREAPSPSKKVGLRSDARRRRRRRRKKR